MKLNSQQVAHLTTPCYLYNMSRLKLTLNDLSVASKKYNYTVHYAIKANVNKDVLQLISSHGFGADCVSGFEIQHAVKQGFLTDSIVFAGVGKTDREIEEALNLNIFCFNCESFEEIEIIEEIASKKGVVANIALRLNPDVDAQTHAYITTGLNENKFGIHTAHLEQIVEFVMRSEWLYLQGLHFHIGSQIQTLEPFKNLCIKANSFLKWFNERHIFIKHINVGGGLGINYESPENDRIDFDAYFNIFHQFLEVKPNQKVHFELGRSIVGQIGYLLSKVTYIKKGISKNFMILDAGMTELMRPALYQAYHKISNLTKHNVQNTETYDVVGPICESTDRFGKHVVLPKSERNDLMLIHSAGAYGQVMANTYNLRPMVKEYCMEF